MKEGRRGSLFRCAVRRFVAPRRLRGAFKATALRAVDAPYGPATASATGHTAQTHDGAENGQKRLTWANLEHPLHVRSDAHLLRELRALCEECGTTEIIDLEDLQRDV